MSGRTEFGAGCALACERANERVGMRESGEERDEGGWKGEEGNEEREREKAVVESRWG